MTLGRSALVNDTQHKKFSFLRVDVDDYGRWLIWRSDPLSDQGSFEEVFCREDWFWANSNGRWMIQNHCPEEVCGFRTLRFTPTYPNQTRDCFVS